MQLTSWERKLFHSLDRASRYFHWPSIWSAICVTTAHGPLFLVDRCYVLTAYLAPMRIFAYPSSPPPLLAVAGFVSDDRQWVQGERRWRSALAKAGIEH